MANPIQITFDAADPPAQAEFWALALGYVLQPPPPEFDSWEAFAVANNIPEENRGDFGAVCDPSGLGPRVLFLKVPESKTAKNRMHLDVHHSDPKAHVDALVAAGATQVAEREEFGVSWTVLTDPEGNEFCVAASDPDHA